MSRKQPAEKPRNPNDSTFRNVNALKKQIAVLSARCSDLEARVRDLEDPGPQEPPIGEAR